jgi:hypothetical protein
MVVPISAAESRQEFGEEPVTVHGYGVGRDDKYVVHLFPTCLHVNRHRRQLADLGTVTVPGSRVCVGCRRRITRTAKATATRARKKAEQT